MTNRIDNIFSTEKKILSIYFTAGYPKLLDTVSIIKELAKSGVDMIEIGLPFSDPLADGPTIQTSSTLALKNGMTTQVLFDQLMDIRKEVSIPLLIMGYFNPMLQFGVEKFCQKCKEVGIDGLIIPDLPLSEFEEQYRTIFQKYNLYNIFLITPQTSEARIREIDKASNGFIYMVSSSSTTGANQSLGSGLKRYSSKVDSLNLENPRVVGFGIHNADTFIQATDKAAGAIIGSAFITMLTQYGIKGISKFIQSIRK